MRTGAIFARGSCRALKWMALVGMLFALGSAQAAAQSLTLSTDSTVEEGEGSVPINVTLSLPADTASPRRERTVTVTLTMGHASTTGVANQAGLPDGTGGPDGTDPAGSVDEAADLTWDTPASNQNQRELTFNLSENADSDTLRVRYDVSEDNDAEDEHFVITATSSITPDGGTATSGPSLTGSRAKAVRIDDDETQVYELTITDHDDRDRKINEGDDVALMLEADPAPTIPVMLEVDLSSANDDSDYDLGTTRSTREDVEIPASLTGDTNVSVSLMSEDNDGDRKDDTVTFTVRYAGGSMRGDEVDVNGGDGPFIITVVDQNKLPGVERSDDIKIKVGTATKTVSSLMEGQEGTVTLELDRTGDGVPDSEKITVELKHADSSSASRQDYRLDKTEVEFAATAKTGTFMVDVLDDEDVGEEMLTLMAVVSGEKDNGDETVEVALDAIMFGDTTTRKVEPKADDVVKVAVTTARAAGDANKDGLWTPSETLKLMANELFTYDAMATNIVLGNIQVDNTDVVSASTTNDYLMVTAKSKGMAMITVTATATDKASSAIQQTVSNVAQVAFEVMVDAQAITAMSQADVDAAVAAAIVEEGGDRFWGLDDGMVMVPLEKLFNVPDGISPSYLAESSDDDVVMARVSGDDMYVNLTHMSAGGATIMVTAIDTDSGATASVSFDITVYASRGVTAKSQAEVDEVFEAAGASGLVAQGPSISVDMSALYDVAEDEGWSARYSAETSDPDVLMTSVSGTSLTLTPGSDPAGGMATITVTLTGTHEQGGGRGVWVVEVMYKATVGKLASVVTITADPMDMVEEGGSITVTAMLNQKATADMTVKLQVTGPATPAEAEIMLMTGMESASTMLMASDDYDPMSDWNDIVIVASHEAIMGGSAVMTLSVTENDSEITYTLMDLAEMNLVEGSEYELTVTAEPAVPMDTEVTIMRDRANSDADEDDYTVGAITIMAGETSGSTMLMVTDDGPGDAGHGSPEVLTLFGMVGNMQTNSVSVNLWDMAVPVLPVIAQLLLAAFLAVGGYRRYRRR